MPVNSNQKGKRGERQVARLLRNFGFEARRGQQFSGGGDSPDVVHTIPNHHIEVKFTERLSVYDALNQAEVDSADDTKIPVVFHRRKRHPWLVILDARDYLELIVELGERHDKIKELEGELDHLLQVKYPEP